jgi:histidinol-phosphate/aromatic aminotransferase/cobyric acid decarboxylase-like protein
MTHTLRPQPGILDIALYVGGESRIEGRAEVLKLSSNENPFGPSRRAVEAFRGAAGDLHRYPSTDHRRLREAIGDVHGLDPDRIVCGVGSDEILQMVAQAYAGPGDEIILTEHGFSMYPILGEDGGCDARHRRRARADGRRGHHSGRGNGSNAHCLHREPRESDGYDARQWSASPAGGRAPGL